MQNKSLLKMGSLFLSFFVFCFGCPAINAETAVDLPQNNMAQTGDVQPEIQALTLEECYRLALIQSEIVAIQKEAITRATAQMFAATSQSLGDVDFVMTRNFEDTQKEITSVSHDPDASERKFTISQPLFQGFKAMGALTGAGSYKKEQTEAWIRAKELLYKDVAFAFYNVLRFQKELKIVQTTHELLRERISELEEREQLGRSRASEVATAETKLKSIEAEFASTKRSYSAAQYLLEFLIGITIEGRELEDKVSEDFSSKKLTDYLNFASSRSDVKAAEQAVKTAKSGIIVAQSGFWPTINLDHTQYLRREGALSGVDWDLLFTVNVPLFSGTETVGKVKDSVSILKQKKLSLSLSERLAELEIKQNYNGWRFSYEQYTALKEAVASADKNYQLQSEEYRRSLVNNLDVLAALEALHSTQQNENRAFYQMKQDEAQLRVAIGKIL